MSGESQEETHIEMIRKRILAEIRQDWNFPVLVESDFAVDSSIYHAWRTFVHLGTLVQSEQPQRRVVVKEFNRATAVKVLDAPARREKLYQYFRRECGMWREIGTHPNIVEVLGIMESYRGSIFPAIVMPYYPLRDLRYLVDNSPSTPVKTRAKLMHDVAKGLMYLHSLSPPVVHRDIKGNNILVKEEGSLLTACVADFGSAKFSFANDYDIASTTKLGALDWLSPERLMEKEESGSAYSIPTCASDMWSYACTFLEVLTARNPWGFDGCSYELLLSGGHPDRPDDIHIDKVYWSLMLKCWRRKPQDRPSSEDVAIYLKSLRLSDS